MFLALGNRFGPVWACPDEWDDDIEPPPGAGIELVNPWSRRGPDEPDPLARFLAWLARLLRALVQRSRFQGDQIP